MIKLITDLARRFDEDVLHYNEKTHVKTLHWLIAELSKMDLETNPVEKSEKLFELSRTAAASPRTVHAAQRDVAVGFGALAALVGVGIILAGGFLGIAALAYAGLVAAILAPAAVAVKCHLNRREASENLETFKNMMTMERASLSPRTSMIAPKFAAVAIRKYNIMVERVRTSPHTTWPMPAQAPQ